MLLRDTISTVLREPFIPASPPPEIERTVATQIPVNGSQAIVLTGVRRSGKSTLLAQLMRRKGGGLYCNFEDIRLFGMGPEDFPTFLSALEALSQSRQRLFLDEVQEVPQWQRLARTLLDRGRSVCVTGSNASLLGRELGAKLTGRHLSFEVFPFSFREYLRYVGQPPGPDSLKGYLENGGFPMFLRERNELVLQELLRDVVQRDVAARHRLRETRHVMNLLLFLLANTGQPLSFQRLAKGLAIPTVAQASRYVGFLQDSYLLFAVQKYSSSFKKRLIAPVKYYSIDNGLRRANSPQTQPDLGHRLENAVALCLRRRAREVFYAGERDSWECDFLTNDEAIQVCLEATPTNRTREIKGLLAAARLRGNRRCRLLTLDQTDRLREDGVEIEILPAWQWLD